MALTEAKIKDLEAKQFDKLYATHKAMWAGHAKTAFAHAKAHITGGRDPRPDDVAKVLYPILQVNDDLRKHQEDNAARGKRFVEWFVEYVIDQAIKK